MEKDIESDLLKKIQQEGTDSAFIEHLLSTLLNTFPDHIYLKDTKSRFLLVNNSLLTLFGKKSSDDVTGKTDFDFFTEEHARAAYEDEQEIMRSGIGKSNFIEKETWDDGTISWVASTKVPFYDQKKKIVGIFGISRDITPRRKAELEIENRARELDGFIEISAIAKKKELSAEGYLKKINDIIPDFFSHVHIISSRLVIGHKAFKSPGFKETEYKKKYKIQDDDSDIGILVVFFDRDFKRIPNKIPQETNQVIKLICDRISEILERKWLEKDLRKWEHIISDANSHLDLYP